MRCTLCPRNCGAERTPDRGGGVCGMPSLPVAARAMLHRWEEPCLTGDSGAGAVFFSGCSLGCVYCQNREISRPRRDGEAYRREASPWNGEASRRDGNGGVTGRPLTVPELRDVFRRLVSDGAACLDLVTPSHFTPAVLEALGEDPWPVPVVWNCGGYEKPDTLKLLEGKVQVYLPDLKYALPGPAKRYSGAEDYFDWAASAIREMFRQTGPYRLEGGRLLSGVLIRHLVLPGELDNTRRVIDWVSEMFRPGDVLFSLMRQYTPQPGAVGNLSRRVTGAEYRAALAYMENCGIREGYTQEGLSAEAAYTPDFDLRGLE